MTRQNAINYQNPNYPYATDGADLFKKEDVQLFAQAHDSHDHSNGFGLPAARLAAGVASGNIGPLGGVLTGSLPNPGLAALPQPLTFATDTTYDIGAVTSARPRDLYVGRNVFVGVGGNYYNYNVYTDASNYERGFFRWSSSIFETGVEAAGTGQAHAYRLTVAGQGDVIFSSNFADRWRVEWQSGDFLPWDDNVESIGNSGKRVKNVYAGTAFIAPNALGTGNAARYGFGGGTNAQVGVSAYDPNTLLLSGNGTAMTIAQGTVRLGATPLAWGVDLNNTDVFLYRDAANTLAQRNGVNAQTLRIYSAYTDASNYARLAIQNNGAGIQQIFCEAAGTGAQQALSLNASSFYFATAGATKWQMPGAGHILAATDNAYDIGAYGVNRPRYVYVGTQMVVGGNPTYYGDGFIQSSAGANIALTPASNIVEQRNGTNSQILRIYNTYTDASNYQRLTTFWTGGQFEFQTQAAGTSNNGDFRLGTQGNNGNIIFDTNNVNRWQISGPGMLLASADNTYDIGASGANRPRNIFAAGNLTLGGIATLGGNLTVSGGTINLGSGGALQTSGTNLLLYAPAGGTVQAVLQGGGGWAPFYAGQMYSSSGLQLASAGWLQWATGAGVLSGLVYFGGNDSLVNAQNSTVVYRRNYDAISVLTIYGTGFCGSVSGFACYSAAISGYGFICPNTASANGEGVAYAWITYSSVEHARQYGLRVAKITDPVGLLQSVNAYAYEHTSFTPEGEPIRGEDGSYASTASYGFSAREVATNIPEAAAYDEQAEPIGVDAYRMLAVLWEACQRIEQRLEVVESRQ
jgi:hypothetical protein